MNSDVACQELVELLSDYMDNQLPQQSRADVELHLADCPGCQVALEHLRSSVARTRSVEVAALTPEVRQRLLEEFRGITG